MKDDFVFSSKFQYDVEVYDDDQGVIGQGQLSFGDGTLICIQFDLTQYYEAPQREFSILKAKTKDGQKLTLLNCELERYSLYADFIVLGDIKSEITYFHVKYGDVSDWFLRGQYVTGQIGENISWKNQVPQLSVSVNTTEENFSLKTDTIGSLTKRGEDHVIHEHTRFIFERTDGGFSVEEVKEKSFELSTLLSVLTSNSISIANVWVGCVASYAMPIYFSAFRKVDRESSRGEFWLSCLAQRHSLDDKWQSVFDRYYASNYRKTSWVRLAGMQRYEGFWEFKILGYVSLLDEYVSSYAAMANQKATKAESKRVTKFVERLKLLKHPLNDAQFKDIESLVGTVFLMSRDLTFREKYDYAIGLTDKDILKVINLTDDDFSLIKRIRDKVAHGDTLDLADTSYQEIHFIVEKIALLMTYWAHADLGFSPSEFSTALMRTHNCLRFNPKLDKIYLERITNSAQFIPVSQELFVKFASGDGPIINACFTQNLSGELTYSEEYKAMYEAWIKDRSRASNKIIDAFGVAPERFSAVGSLYLEYGDEIKELHGAYIIRDI
ncbi:hypothetical protein CP336_14715 [Pseudomonas fluorescens]|nr:hypothetical protein CP336_14715 [Pseudomonas fluorescens]